MRGDKRLDIGAGHLITAGVYGEAKPFTSGLANSERIDDPGVPVTLLDHTQEPEDSPKPHFLKM